MISCALIRTCVRNFVRLGGSNRQQMSNQICGVVSRPPSSACFCSLSLRCFKSKYIGTSVVNTKSSLSFSRPGQRSYWHSLTVKNAINSRHSRKTCFDISLGSQSMNAKLLVPKQKQGLIPRMKCNVRPVSWLQGCASAGLMFGSLVCYSTSEPVHAEAPLAKHKVNDCSSSTVSFSHGKQVHTDYSVIGIPGDGRCLFRSVAHGACLRSGKPAPNESLQRELADELRARVADEFVKRRKETEWFIEGDFDTYVSQIRKPHVWGGEPELLMASHVLKMPITVYMKDQDSGGLISIAEYGQEYSKEDPIRVLYHGFGHYDALHLPGKKDARSRL